MLMILVTEAVNPPIVIVLATISNSHAIMVSMIALIDIRALPHIVVVCFIGTY